MAKRGKTSANKGRVLGRGAYAAMAAVEGMKLSKEGARLVAGVKGASTAQRRAAAKRAFIEADARRK